MIYCTGCGKLILFTRPPIGVDKYFHNKACYMKWSKQYQEGEPYESRIVSTMFNTSVCDTPTIRDNDKV